LGFGGSGGDGSGGNADGDVPVFLHGVASGDPLNDRVILWTRVTTDQPGRVPVSWQIATDPGMQTIGREGSVNTDADRDHTVKVDPTGLQAGRTYYYRFFALGSRSPIGRTRTAPAGPTERLRIAFTSCSQHDDGFFNVYRAIAARADLDLVLHLGDYIYENGGQGDLGRGHEPPREIVSLQDYRIRYAQYRLDPDLQEVHRQHPMVAVWDDHESTNNSWRDGAENHDQGEGDWQARKALSIRVYYEWLPIREVEPGRPERIFRRFGYGDLLDLIMLDTRLIGRDRQLEAPIAEPNTGGGLFADRGAFAAADRQLLGQEQEAWLAEQLGHSTAQWKILGQQVMFGQLKVTGAPNAANVETQGGQGGTFLNPDQWDGYFRARDRVWQMIRGNRSAPEVAIDNVAVLTGDIHTSWAMDITEDPNNPLTYNPLTGQGSMAVEFVTPSVTSSGLPELQQLRQAIRLNNPHMKFIDLESHGYVLLDIDAERLQAEWWFVDTITERQEGESFATAFLTRAGENRLQQAGAPSQPKPNPPALAPASDARESA